MIANIIIGIMTPGRTAFAENFKEAPDMSFAMPVSGGKQSVITIQILCRHAAVMVVSALNI